MSVCHCGYPTAELLKVGAAGQLVWPLLFQRFSRTSQIFPHKPDLPAQARLSSAPALKVVFAHLTIPAKEVDLPCNE